tara:strand:- start:1580 stop:2431 length:852 start_codon:yes stop_codon:yes gene_type:complete
MKRINIIAEIGINHNGDIKISKELIHCAKKAGCDLVKFQKRDIDLVYTKKQLNSFRESPWGNTFRDQKKGIELSKKEYDEINSFCKDLDIGWFASAWDLNSQKFLNSYDLNYNKIASAMIIDKQLLNEVAQMKKHTFISTGMSNLDIIDEAVNIFKNKNCSFELMHCVSTYPMRDEDANLKCIDTLKKRYSCDVGYSGHEVGLAVSYAAVAFGITSLERHITLSKSMYGSDQSSSLEFNKLLELVGGIRKLEIAIGNGEKQIIKSEKSMEEKLRAHIFQRQTS